MATLAKHNSCEGHMNDGTPGNATCDSCITLLFLWTWTEVDEKNDKARDLVPGIADAI